jgi:hypothetical protein
MNTNLLEYKMDLIAKHLGVYRIEEVAAVMRRQHTNPDDGRIVDVVDFYPPWNAYGTYGKMKICHEYLDEDWQKARFQKYSGFSVDQLPVYDAQTALVRRFGQEHRCEIPVAPFRLMVQPRQDENGNWAKTLILKYLVSPKARQTPPAQTAVYGNGQAANGNGQQTAVRPPTPTPQQPQATNGRSAVTAVSPTEWLERAIAATDPFDFDTCVSRAILFFDSADRVESARIGMFGEWKPGLTAAYLAGIKKYAHTRDELETNQSPVAVAHREAKSAALVEYRKVIDSRQPVGGAA